MNKFTIKRNLVLGALLLVQTMPSFAVDQGTGNMFGVWGSLTLQGDFKSLSPSLNKFKWQIMNQSRTREDSPNGSRFTENLLFSQVGYQFNTHGSFWVGYTHDWIHPLGKSAYQESRPYMDFVWKQNLEDFNLTSRTRMEDRINQTTGNEGYRARQLLQISHPLPFMKDLSVYAGDEVMFYLNQTNWGNQGFTENRIFSGLSYKVTDNMGVDLGYMGQYVNNTSGNNLFTHNLQANVSYKF
jgi:opacity protein-like surface antigen